MDSRKETEIIEGNRLIAEFMGYGFSDTTAWPPNNGRPHDIRELDYDLSWDWLMPVVRKIKEVYPNPATTKTRVLISILNTSLMDVEIESSWKAAVEFIKWHNPLSAL